MMFAPLVRAAHLQAAVLAAAEFDEVVSLKDHVVEFEEGQSLLAIEPRLDAVEGQHAVHRENGVQRRGGIPGS